MEFDSETEIKILLRKIFIFLFITIAATIIITKLFPNVTFWNALETGFGFGILFYIPGRLRDILQLTSHGTVFYTIIYILVFMFVGQFIGDFATALIIIIIIADIGYSIYRVISSVRE